eukprot:RCo013971
MSVKLNGRDEEKGLRRPSKCRWKTYTGDDLDELLPQLQKHYNMSMLLDPHFWESASVVPLRVNSRYTPTGEALIPSWAKYDLVDISDCDEVVPECLLWKHPWINTTAHPTDRTYRKCCVEHRRLLETLRYTLKRMEEVGIRPWLGMGTLLASVRHRGVFIGWDTDVDLYISPADVGRFKEAFRNTHTTPHWFAIDPQTDYGVQHRDMFYIYYTRKRTKGGSHVEVWVWNSRRINISALDPLMFPLQRCELYDLTNVWCPHKPLEMLRQWYGSSWWKYLFTMGKTTVMLT